MRSSTRVLGPLFALVLALAAHAEEPQIAGDQAAPDAEAPALPEAGGGEEASAPDAEAEEASAPGAEGSAGEAVAPEAPGVESANAEGAAPQSADPALSVAVAIPDAKPARPEPKVEVGPAGYDSEGRPGRIHIVARGDTLWDISDAYLGTPWVWPSIWQENEAVENPHLIYPGDRLWITSTEMRRVTAEEAQALLAGIPASSAPDPSRVPQPVTPDADAVEERRPPRLYFSYGDAVGLLSEHQIEGAASLVSGLPERTWLGSQDRVFLGLGESQVEVGDRFTVFRSRRRVYDPDTGELLGYHVHVLGWVEVKEVHPEVALAEIVMGHSEMRVGDRVLPRELAPAQIDLRATPPEIEGRVVFMPESRTRMGSLDLVYLDRGTEQGLDVGNALEVIRSSGTVIEPARRGARVELPDQVIADLVVVSAQRDNAVAVVTHAQTEVLMGDHFRGAAVD